MKGQGIFYCEKFFIFENKCFKNLFTKNKCFDIIYTNIRSELSKGVTQMKRYKIANRFRFIVFVTVMMLAVSFTFAGITELFEVHSAEEPKYIEVSVVEGDTLWDLAKTYGSSAKDIRDIIYTICQINDIKASDLRAGQTIMIPVN